jgi:DNA-binding transcriptional MerR regulator
MSPQRTYAIRDLERLTGVPRSTVHFYVREGLLPPPKKRGQTLADYGEEHLRLINLIRQLREEENLGIKEIRDFLRAGRPCLQPAALDQSLDLLLRYARVHAENPGLMERHVDQALKDAAGSLADLDTDAGPDLIERMGAFLELERSDIADAAKKELDLVFRMTLCAGRFDVITELYRRVLRLAEAGRRAMGRAVHDRLVSELLSNLRTSLQAENLELTPLSPSLHSDLGITSLLTASPPNHVRRRMMWARVCGWHGESGRVIEILNDSRSPARRDLVCELYLLASPLGTTELRLPPPREDDDLLCCAMWNVLHAQAEVARGVSGLGSGAASGEDLRSLLAGLERLEGLQPLPASVDPWPALLIEVRAARLLSAVPQPLPFADLARSWSERALGRVRSQSSEAPIRTLGIGSLVELNLAPLTR